MQTGTVNIAGKEYKYGPMLNADDGNTFYSSLDNTGYYQGFTIFRGDIDWTYQTSWYSTWMAPMPQWIGYDYRRKTTLSGVLIYIDDYATQDTVWYKLFPNLAAGTYKITSVYDYANFAEWYVENKQYFLYETGQAKIYGMQNGVFLTYSPRLKPGDSRIRTTLAYKRRAYDVSPNRIDAPTLRIFIAAFSSRS